MVNIEKEPGSLITELLNKPGDAYVSLYFTQFLIVIAIFHQCFRYLHMKAFLTHTSCYAYFKYRCGEAQKANSKNSHSF